MVYKKEFITALRPFSLIVALTTCGLGTSQAWLDGYQNGWLIALVIIAGLLLQIAVNLINDQRDLKDKTLTPKQQTVIRHNTRLGFITMSIATLLGFYMVSIRGWPLFLLGVVGVLGAWGYTGGVINYKARGLGVALVFWFMGVLLIGGAYYVVSDSYNWSVFWLSLPLSLLSSLLLLSNELRDYEQDRSDDIQTLTVRIGFDKGVKLYYALVIILYLSSVLLYLSGLLSHIILLILSVFALRKPLQLLNTEQYQRQPLTAVTGRFYLIYSCLLLLTVWLPVFSTT